MERDKSGKVKEGFLLVEKFEYQGVVRGRRQLVRVLPFFPAWIASAVVVWKICESG